MKSIAAIVTLSPAAAQMKPWCAENLFGPTAHPYPAPTWTQLGATPDYENLSTNFEIAKNLRLLISVMEQTIAQIQSGESLAGTGDIDGFCLCDCEQDAAYWANFLGTTARTQAEAALNEALDEYLKRLEAKVVAMQTTVYDIVPKFKADVEEIVRSTCDADAMQTCDSKVGIPLKDIYKEESELAQKELETIFLATLDKNGFQNIKTEAETLKSDAEALLSKVLSNIWKKELSSAQVQSE